MVFGDRDQFAIEVLLDRRSNPPPPFEFGYLCFWVEGNRVGDIGAATVVTTLKYILVKFCERRDKRVSNDLWSLSDSDLLQFIQAIIYNGDIPLPDALREKGYAFDYPVLTFPEGHREEGSRFGYAFELCASNPEPFDFTRMLVVANENGQQKLVYEQRGIHGPRSAVFAHGTIETVAQMFIEAF